MELDKIIQELNNRFAEELPEFYKRRIIIWHDEDAQFVDRFEEIVLENAEKVKLTGDNNFAIKKLIGVDCPEKNYLIYNPLSYENLEDNWLLDIELYSESFHADIVSMWMDELGIAPTPIMREQVKRYEKFFNAKERRAKIINQDKVPDRPAAVQLAIMSALCGLKTTNPNVIIRNVLEDNLNIEENSIYQKFVDYEISPAFWEMIEQGTGYKREEDLGQLAIHMLLTASTRTLALEYLRDLKDFLSEAHQAYCYDFIAEWLHSEKKNTIYDVARYVEEEAHLSQRFAKLDVNALVNTECFPCIDECILTRLMKDVSNELIDIEIITSTVEKRRVCAWYEPVRHYYDGLLQVAYMQEFFKNHSEGFHIVEPQKIWKEYTSEYYQMDTYYRQFQLCFQRSLKESHPLLDDSFKNVVNKVEGLYSHWFLGQLGKNWFDACADDLETYGKVLEVPQQENLYAHKVASSNTKICVIISDAMRYEVAATLAEQLKRETQSNISISGYQGIFPTITKFGMAALLPHRSLSVERKNNGLAVLADENYTDSNYRDKVLKNANKSSVALQYKNIIGLKATEKSELVKGMDVVYLYHDTIDEASHTSDSMVFSACEEAITELKNLVRLVVNQFGISNIIITSDHGFLYTYSPLTEDDKVSVSSFAEGESEYGRRYAIVKKGNVPEYLLPVQFLGGNTDYDAYAPRENVRLKMKGSGLNFVHGGASLQEMVVPVIEYHHVRSDSMEYKRNRKKYDTEPVTLNLLSANHKISNMIFQLEFYQVDPVSDTREPATYLVYFTDSNGRQISDMQKIIADKVSDNGTERTFRCDFSLKPLKYSKAETYYLMIVREGAELEVPVREEFEIDIPFAVEEFGFFA